MILNIPNSGSWRVTVELIISHRWRHCNWCSSRYPHGYGAVDTSATLISSTGKSVSGWQTSLRFHGAFRVSLHSQHMNKCRRFRCTKCKSFELSNWSHPTVIKFFSRLSHSSGRFSPFTVTLLLYIAVSFTIKLLFNTFTNSFFTLFKIKHRATIHVYSYSFSQGEGWYITVST